MPLTAVGPSGPVDATICNDQEWLALYKKRPRVTLWCRACGEPLHAKVSGRDLKFFAHDTRRVSCPDGGETREHRMLKHKLASIIRSAGWTALIEAAPTPRDIGGWRADVLAVEPTRADGTLTPPLRRVAFEIQLSSMTPAEGRERTGRYSSDEIEALWVTTRHARWLLEVPGVRAAVRAGSPHSDDAGVEMEGDAATPEMQNSPVADVQRTANLLADDFVVDRGLADLEAGHWRPTPTRGLAGVVTDFLAGRLEAYGIGYFSEQIPHGDRTREHWVNEATALVNPLEAETHSKLMSQFREHLAQATAADEGRWVRLAALVKRQETVLPVAVAHAEAALRPNENIFVGIPPKPIQFGLSRALARGNAKTAHGAVVWIGHDRGNLRVFAVVCPVAARISSGLAYSWRQRGVRVYAENDGEAENLARTMGCSPADVVVPLV